MLIKQDGVSGVGSWPPGTGSLGKSQVTEVSPDPGPKHVGFLTP